MRVPARCVNDVCAEKVALTVEGRSNTLLLC